MTYTARVRLDQGLAELAEQGQRPPCQSWADRGLWLSDSATDRLTAAQLCTSCSLATVCRSAAAESGEAFGVWGGVDRGGLRKSSGSGRPTSQLVGHLPPWLQPPIVRARAHARKMIMNDNTTSGLDTLAAAVTRSLDAMTWLQPADDPTCHLAISYAAHIDEAIESGSPEDLHRALYLGPHLLRTLDALGGTPAGRAAAAARSHEGDGTHTGKLALLRAEQSDSRRKSRERPNRWPLA